MKECVGASRPSRGRRTRERRDTAIRMSETERLPQRDGRTSKSATRSYARGPTHPRERDKEQKDAHSSGRARPPPCPSVQGDLEGGRRPAKRVVPTPPHPSGVVDPIDPRGSKVPKGLVCESRKSEEKRRAGAHLSSAAL